jgi:hypothetical protein
LSWPQLRKSLTRASVASSRLPWLCKSSTRDLIHILQIWLCHLCVREGWSYDRAIVKWIEVFTTLKNVLDSTSYPLPLASKTSFSELYAKSLRAPTLICLPLGPFWLAVKEERVMIFLYFRWIPELQTS